MTTIQQAFINCIIKYATNASGRASRSEFWWFFLLFAILAGACYASATMIPYAGLVLATIIAIPSVWLFVMALIRRIHDHNICALFFLLPIVPFAVLYQTTGEYYVIPESFFELSVALYAVSTIFVLLIIYLLFKPGTLGENRYGADPSHAPTSAKAYKATKVAAQKQAQDKAQTKEQAKPQETTATQTKSSAPAPAKTEAPAAAQTKAQEQEQAPAKAQETTKVEAKAPEAKSKAKL